MTEIPSCNPEQNEPQDPFASPEGEALIAFAELDELLAMWMKFHPDVDERDVDAALARFRGAIKSREEGKEPPTE